MHGGSLISAKLMQQIKITPFPNYQTILVSSEPLDLQRHQSDRHEADEEHRRRRRDAGAGNQEGEAGIGDPSEDQPLTGGKGRPAGTAADAGTAPVVAVRSAAGEPAREH
jgi:hypothetical protein